MRAIVHPFKTEIFPGTEDIKELCKIGEGANACVFLAISSDGWECHGLNKQPIWSFIERARRGETNARREGCDIVNNFHPNFSQIGEIEIEIP